MIFSCSLSPVVVIVSRLFCGRRFERSEEAAHGATDDARVARAYTTGGVAAAPRGGAAAAQSKSLGRLRRRLVDQQPGPVDSVASLIRVCVTY